MSRNLMPSAEVKDLVRDAYRNVPRSTLCSPTVSSGSGDSSLCPTNIVLTPSP
jgi:hypothetical protein